MDIFDFIDKDKGYIKVFRPRLYRIPQGLRSTGSFTRFFSGSPSRNSEFISFKAFFNQILVPSTLISGYATLSEIEAILKKLPYGFCCIAYSWDLQRSAAIRAFSSESKQLGCRARIIRLRKINSHQYMWVLVATKLPENRRIVENGLELSAGEGSNHVFAIRELAFQSSYHSSKMLRR